MRYVDLFSGIGGFHIAAKALGYECVGYSEIDKSAIETWKQNFGDKIPYLGDITQIDRLPKNLDLVTAGVPCQPWSVAGDSKGFEDERGRLWFKTLDLIFKARPTHVILENVRGLTYKCHQDSLALILDSLRDNGYYVSHKVLDSIDFGLPQERKRLFIVASLQNSNFKFPKGTRNTNYLGSYLPGLEVLEKSREKFFLSDLRNSPNYIHSWEIKNLPPHYQAICNGLLPLVKEGKKDNVAFDLAKMKPKFPELHQDDLDILCDYGILKLANGKYRFRHNSNNYGFEGYSRIVFPNSTTFPTLTKTGVSAVIALSSRCADSRIRTINEVILGKQYRKITGEDSRILQGFPKDFKIHKKDKVAVGQFGNAVSIPVVRAIIAAL